MNTETEIPNKPDTWDPTTLQKVAAFVYTLGSFRVVIAALIAGAIVGAIFGQWFMYATVALILWFNGKTAYETATFPATGQRVYGFHNVESRDAANARKEAAGK